MDHSGSRRPRGSWPCQRATSPPIQTRGASKEGRVCSVQYPSGSVRRWVSDMLTPVFWHAGRNSGVTSRSAPARIPRGRVAAGPGFSQLQSWFKSRSESFANARPGALTQIWENWRPSAHDIAPSCRKPDKLSVRLAPGKSALELANVHNSVLRAETSANNQRKSKQGARARGRAFRCASTRRL